MDASTTRRTRQWTPQPLRQQDSGRLNHYANKTVDASTTTPTRQWTPQPLGQQDSLYTPEQCLLVGCLTSQQQASVSQGRICSDNFTCCHTETEVAHQTFYLTQSQYADTGLTSPSADPITPGAWQGSHWSANF